METVTTLIAAAIAGCTGGLLCVDLQLTNTLMMGVVIAGALGLYFILDLTLQGLAKQLGITS